MTNYEQIKMLTQTQMNEFLRRNACEKCAYYESDTMDCQKPKSAVCRDGINIWLNMEHEKGGKYDR